MNLVCCSLAAICGEPTGLPDGYPAEEGARSGASLAEAWLHWVENGPGGKGLRPEVYDCMVKDARARAGVWNVLLSIRLQENNDMAGSTVHRRRMAYLREKLGWPAFYAAEMPAPVPRVP